MDKDFYNSSSAAKLSWTPKWFGCEEFDFNLVKAVKKWQKENGLKPDGLVGPATYRRIWTERQARASGLSDWTYSFTHVMPKEEKSEKKNKHIVHNSNPIPIEWDKVVLWDENHGLRADKGCYTDYSGRPDRKPIMFVNHWDVCLSSKSCMNALNNSKISVHFLIDNDGTIYQTLDTQHKAWHAGVPKYKGGNEGGIGVEISNAYYLKYQNWYIENGFGERPINKNVYVHGRKLKPFLGFYPIQIDALKALFKSIHLGIGIPLTFPKNINGGMDSGVNKNCRRGQFNGFCNHYNFTKNKIDCAGLDLPSILDEIF